VESEVKEHMDVSLPLTEESEPQEVAKRVAKLVLEIFGDEVRADPATIHQEIMAIFLRSPARVKVEQFVAEVTQLGYRKPLGAYLPPSPRRTMPGASYILANTPEDAKFLEWLMEDEQSKSYYFCRFEAIFVERGGD